MPNSANLLNRYILLLSVSVTFAGCSSCTNQDGTEWDLGDDLQAPAVPTDGRWRPTDGPVMGRESSGAHRDELLGMIDGDFILEQDSGETSRLLRVDGGNGSWETMDGPEEAFDSDEIFKWVGEAGDSVFVMTNRGTYHRSVEGDSWQRDEHIFSDVFLHGDTLYGRTASFFDAAPATLFRREPGGDWVQVLEDIHDITVTGDLIHVYYNGDERDFSQAYSADGGRTWTPHESSINLLLDHSGAVKVDGEYWASISRHGRIKHSSDGESWELEILDGVDGIVDGLISHDGELHAILRSESAQQLEGTDTIIKRTEQGWTSIEGPTHVRLQEISSVGGNLYAMTLGAGLWRLRDDGESWRSIGPSLSAPGYIGAGEDGLCALSPVIGLAACRSGEGAAWTYDGLGESRSIEDLFDDRGRIFFRVMVNQEHYPGPTELWQFRDGQVRRVSAETLDLERLDGAFIHADETYVLQRSGGLGRLDDDGTLDALTRSITGDFSHYSDATSAHGMLWTLARRGDAYELKRSVDGRRWEPAAAGLPTEGEPDLRPPHAVSFARTQEHLYTLVYHYRDSAGGTNTLADVYLWNQDQQRWQPTAVPSAEELGQDHFRFIRGGERTVYASTMTEVYQFNPAENEWVSISEGLDAQISPRSLEAYQDEIYVGVKGRGVYQYAFDAPAD